MWILGLKGLIRFDATKLTCLVSLLTYRGDLPKTFEQNRCQRMQKVHFHLTYFAQKLLKLPPPTSN